MKESLVVACLLSAFAMSSFAQATPATTPAELGAKLVAERDAAWLRAHSGPDLVPRFMSCEVEPDTDGSRPNA
jgi:hypothetical protein